MREQEDSSKFVRERAINAQDMMAWDTWVIIS